MAKTSLMDWARPIKEKTKVRDNKGNYITKTVVKKYDSPSISGTKTTVKTRRTMKAIRAGLEPGNTIKIKDITKRKDRIGIPLPIPKS